MSPLRHLLLTLATFSLFSSNFVSAKAVFAHYMLADIGPEQSTQDVTEAKAMGFDAFAINIHTPNDTWTDPALERLFSAANKNGFKLFFSLDLNVHPNWQDFQGIMSKYLGNSAYFTGTWNKKPMVSTFGAGGMGPPELRAMKEAFANNIYFAPGADLTQGYYKDSDGWFKSWDTTIDGTFSWNAAWPWGLVDTSNPNNLDLADDRPVIANCQKYKKGAMVALSSVQYKRLDKEHFYRAGNDMLAKRMQDILNMGDAAEFVQVISWNDAGESHYISKVWPEAVGSEVLKYANSQDFDHSGWKPLFTSFISAYKSGSQTMGGNSTTSSLGSIWYHPALKSCGNDIDRPSGFQGVKDAVNYAYVIPSTASGYQLKILGRTVDLKPGFNYGSVEGLQVGGPQSATLTDGQGNVVSVATGTKPVTNLSPQSPCYYNFVVYEAKPVSGSSGTVTPSKRAGLLEKAMKGSTGPKLRKKRHVHVHY